MENLEKLVNTLRSLPNEQPWLEFKHNNYKPEMIGADISALANGAVLSEKDCAYMIWGIDDTTHAIVGTTYDLQSLKVGAQEIENWLRSLLSDQASFSFRQVAIENQTIGVLTIHCAQGHPVTFKSTAYIRVGSYTKKLQDYPSLEAALWDKLRTAHFEEQAALTDLTADQALQLLDTSTYFEKLHLPLPTSTETALHPLLEDHLLRRQDNGLYYITNLGALLFARRLSHFDQLSRKSIRLVQYAGKNKVNILRQESLDIGYVQGFSAALKLIESLLPAQEVIGDDGSRTQVHSYPPLVIREALANALIHQSFAISGTGPLVELFDNRIEITNPGKPLIDIFRIIDNPPRSRNERLARLMRRLGL